MKFILILNFLLWVKVIQSAADSFHITSEMFVLKMHEKTVNKLYNENNNQNILFIITWSNRQQL